MLHRYFWLEQSVWAALHAVCVLFALAPFGVWPLAFFAAFAVFMAAKRLQGESLVRLVATGGLFAGAVTFITFGWIVATIHRYTGQSVGVTALLSLAYAGLCQTKFLVFFVVCRYAFRKMSFSLIEALALSAALALCDALMPELFPWSWGNALAAQEYFRQWASIGSVYLVSFWTAFGGSALAAMVVEGRQLNLLQ